MVNHVKNTTRILIWAMHGPKLLLQKSVRRLFEQANSVDDEMSLP